MTGKELLLGGADYLEKHGWRQGDYGHPGGPACLYGACAFAAGLYPWAWPLRQVEDCWYAHDTHTTPINFNDAPGRTVDEVVAKLREIASKCAE